jgi:hydroxypyruvate isomerase
MPRFSANISTLFGEHDLLDRVAAAADCGFGAFGVKFPYDIPIESWVRAKKRAGISISVINLPVGDLMAGGPGLAAVPGREGQFRAAVAEAYLYAEALNPHCVNLLAGIAPAKLDISDCRATLHQNTRYAAEALASLGVRVVVEPINTRDRPGFLLPTSIQAMSLIETVGHSALGLQCDLYHMHMMGEALVETLTRLMPRIGHIQFADSPGRHEPGTGEINFSNVFARIDELAYPGWVDAEYLPTRETKDTLQWLQETA